MSIFPRHDSSLQQKPLQPISVLVPFSALIISVAFVVLFLIRYYILEGFLIQWLYGPIYKDMSDNNRRGFINHHIAGMTKIVIWILAAYPFIDVTLRNANFYTPFIAGSFIKMGDILIVAAQLLIAMYIFELFYRVKLSAGAVMHHIGTIIIGQSAIAISLRLTHEPDADIEFILCTVWGAFDIFCELFPHIAIILYRIFPQRHRFLGRLFLLSCITTAAGTACETMVTMYLFGSLWDKWQIAFKVSTPLLHLAFSAAQVHGSIVFWKMYRRQQSLAREKSEEDREKHYS